MVSQKQKTWIKWSLVLTVIILGGLILGTSMIRTSLIEVLKEEKENKLRTEPIEFIFKNEEGAEEKKSYKLPSVNLLPTDFLYSLKQTREDLWIRFCNDSYDKSRLLLLIADKRAYETKLLIEKKNSKLALNTIQKAIDTLKYSRKEIKNYKENQVKIELLNEQIFKATIAYQKILDCNQKVFSDTEREECKKIFEGFDNWIKKENSKEKNS